MANKFMKVVGSKFFRWTSKFLLVVGALAWFLVSFGFNIVEAITGGFNFWARFIYFFVGLAGVVFLINWMKR